MKYKITMIIESRRKSPVYLLDKIWDKVNESADVLVRDIKIKKKRRSK
jgi:hypothetical protein